MLDKMIEHCDSCEKTRKENTDLKKRIDDFHNIAKHIIQVDVLLHKFNEKELEIEKLKDELEARNRESNSAAQRLKSVLKDNDTIKKENSKLNDENKHVTKQLNDLNKQVRYLEDGHRQANDDLKVKLNEIDKLTLNIKHLEEKNTQLNQRLVEWENKPKPVIVPAATVEVEEKPVSETVVEEFPVQKTDEKAVTFYLADEKENDESKSDSESSIDSSDSSSTSSSSSSGTGCSLSDYSDEDNDDQFAKLIENQLENQSSEDKKKIRKTSTSADVNKTDVAASPVPQPLPSTTSSTQLFSLSFENAISISELVQQATGTVKEKEVAVPEPVQLPSDDNMSEAAKQVTVAATDVTAFESVQQVAATIEDEMEEADLMFVDDKFDFSLSGDEEKAVSSVDEHQEVVEELTDTVVKEGIENELCITFADNLYQKQMDSFIDECVDEAVHERFERHVEMNRVKMAESVFDSMLKGMARDVVNEIAFERRCLKAVRECLLNELIDEQSKEIARNEFGQASGDAKEKRLETIFAQMASKEFIKPIERQIPLQQQQQQPVVEVVDTRTLIDMEESPFVIHEDEMESPQPKSPLQPPLVTPKPHSPPSSPIIAQKTPIPKQPIHKTPPSSVACPIPKSPMHPPKPSTERTLKSQLSFLNSIKKSSTPVARTTKLVETVDVVSIIKERKRALEESFTKKLEGTTTSKAVVSAKRETASVETQAKPDLKRKRESIDTNEPSPIKMPTDWESTICLSPSESATTAATTTTPKPAKSFYADTVFVDYCSKTLSTNAGSQSPSRIRADTDYLKIGLGTYFRKFNIKTGFTFDELDDCINSVFINTGKDIKADMLVLMLTKHFMNNHYVPITEKSHEIFPTMHNVKMTNEEEKYIYLLKKLKDHPKYSNVHIDFINKLKQLLLTNNFNNFYNLRITRMITFLCRSLQQPVLLHIFVYDLLYTKTKKNLHEILLLIPRIWSECLQLPQSTTAVSPILLTISYITLNHVRKNVKENQSQLLNIFGRLCNWNLNGNECAKDLHGYLHGKLRNIKNLIVLNQFEFKLNDVALQYLSAFKLLCKYEGWKWSFNVFVMQFINDLLVEWTSKSPFSDSDNISDDLMGFYLHVETDLITNLCPLSEISCVTDCIQSLLLLMNDSSLKLLSFLMQCTIIHCLLLFTPFDLSACFNQIHKWCKNNLTNGIPVELKTKIKCVYEAYKSKLPNMNVFF